MTKAQELMKDFNATIETLIDAIESEKVTEELQAFCKQAAKFTRYSLRNQVLIMLQDENASQVAGYKTWQTSFKRQVMKGEHGIRILAPHHYKALNEKGIEEDKIGFHATAVFDIRQTDGEPLEDYMHVSGDTGGELFETLKAYSEQIGQPVSLCDYEQLGDIDGTCSPGKIEINDSLSMVNKVGVLVHELGHHLAGHTGSDTARDMREWEAETISFIFCERFGIANKAPQYLKGWGATRENIKASLGTVSKVSSEIIRAVEATTGVRA